MSNNIDNLKRQMFIICLIDNFLLSFGFFSFYTIYALFFLLVLDAFECSRLNKEEDFNTISGFEYLYELACCAPKGIKRWLLTLFNNRQEPSSPVSVNSFPEMSTHSTVPGNLRTNSCITETHRKALEDEDAQTVAVKNSWINRNFHSIGEQMYSETEAYNDQNNTKTH